jgi:large subunit ribosomal protein L24
MVQPRKVRKDYYTQPKQEIRKNISSHLSNELYSKYGTRSLSVIKGDTVKVQRGKFKGFEGKISKVNVKDRKLAVEGITISKSDKKQVLYYLDASNLLITKLSLDDKKRIEKLRKIAEIKKIAFVEPEPEKEEPTEAKQELPAEKEEPEKANEEPSEESKEGGSV